MKFSDPIPILLFSASEYLMVTGALATGKYTIYYLGPAGHSSSFSRYCKKYFICARTDSALAQQINTIVQKYSISAVIPLDLSATVCMARIRSSLSCPVSPLSSVHDIMLLANKWKSNMLLRTLGIRSPKTVLIRTPQELTDRILDKPFLIKPILQGGGKGIEKMNSEEDVQKYKGSFSPFKTYPLIAEEYVKGSDIDLSVLASNGVIHCWTIQRWLAKGELEFIDDPEVYEVGRKIVKRLRYNGLLHIDMRRDARTGRLFVVDCNPRAWGSMSASIGSGVDFIDLAIRSSQNKRVPAVKQQNTTYIAPIRFLGRIVRNPRIFYKSSYATRHDFLAIFRDPLPYIILLLKVCIVYIERKYLYMTGDHKRLIDNEKRTFLSHITN